MPVWDGSVKAETSPGGGEEGALAEIICSQLTCGFWPSGLWVEVGVGLGCSPLGPLASLAGSAVVRPDRLREDSAWSCLAPSLLSAQGMILRRAGHRNGEGHC